tara:strand:- start:364 stop:552 length:189 start_codon:yes stop_codon:yes gene_type:complete
MAEEKQKVQRPTPRTYSISSEQLMDVMRYLMTRPYGEVVKIMNMLSTLNSQGFNEGKDDGKK